MSDVCVEGLCSTEDDEPNGTFTEFTELGELDDTDAPLMFTSQLSGDLDVDIHQWTCNDTPLGSVTPTITVTAAAGFRTCLFLDCAQGGNPIFECPDGTVEDTANVGFLPGCCRADGMPIDLSAFNCPDSNDETIDAYLRSDMAAADACTEYVVEYGC